MEDDRPDRLKVSDWDRHRENIIKKQGRYCQFCGLARKAHEKQFDSDLHVHHVIPRSEGGSDDPANLMVVCNRCHYVLENATDHIIQNIRAKDKDIHHSNHTNAHLASAVSELSHAIDCYSGATGQIEDLQEQLIELLESDRYNDH